MQATFAARDLRNLLADVCDSLAKRYGSHTHELVVLDDLTVYDHVIADPVTLDIYPVHLDDSGNILSVFVESPVEAD